MNIIVTGASKGIGYEIVRKMAGMPGMKMIAIARSRNGLDDLQHACAELPSGKSLKVIPADLSDFSGFKDEVIPEIYSEFDHLDILVNNAGYLVNKPFDKTGEEELEMTIRINFIVPWMMIQLLTDLLLKSGKSHIVNISSIGGIQGSIKFPGLSAYSSAKGALGILTECLATELADKKISCNCLALGSVRTEMFRRAFPGYNAQLKPDEIAGLIADFALNGHKYFNGKILPVSVSNP
jgi:NAD(P)-dependent dehydrogenase (short-subunit alcohol dehydrogenase family)